MRTHRFQLATLGQDRDRSKGWMFKEKVGTFRRCVKVRSPLPQLLAFPRLCHMAFNEQTNLHMSEKQQYLAIRLVAICNNSGEELER